MICLIAAISNNGIIGKDNTIPWKCKEDMQYFKRMTEYSHVIMGRKTYESLSEPLKNRNNFVITTKYDEPIHFTENPNLTYVRSFNNAINVINYKKDYDRTFIIGGSSIYSYCLNLYIPDVLYISKLFKDYDGDTYFPEIPTGYEVVDIIKYKDFLSYRYNRRQR